jgi:hypothetical protein
LVAAAAPCVDAAAAAGAGAWLGDSCTIATSSGVTLPQTFRHKIWFLAGPAAAAADPAAFGPACMLAFNSFFTLA